ncbi:hypothetical protein FRB93_013008 [Tulasnella sp. JGI-2019a]|nr:hypothetical protein FRB93_013008 [Tulasnella sp. JGI-2019a]
MTHRHQPSSPNTPQRWSYREIATSGYDYGNDRMVQFSFSQVPVSYKTDPIEVPSVGESDERYLPETGVDVESVANSERSSSPTISTLYPEDSASQCMESSTDSRSRGDKVNESGASVHSFNSSEDGHLFKKVHGRAFTSQSDHYMLPADDREHSRLNLQHNLLRHHLGALYPYSRQVEWILRPGQPSRPAVLDIGTGSGRWAVEMALQFPHVDVLGVDLVPPVLLTVDTIPLNCRFEVDDANLSMSHHAESFDVVHVRSAEAGINDFNGFLYEVAQTIRPGGMVILNSAMPQMRTDDLVPFPVTEPGEEGFSWVQKLFYHTYTAFHNRGNYAIDATLHWVKWLENNPNFENVRQSDTFIPVGAWQEGLDEIGTWVAESMKIDLMHVWQAFKPLLLNDGLSPEYVEILTQGATEELRNQTIHAKLPWRYCTAIRKNTPWQERLEMPEPLDLESEALIVHPSPPGTSSIVSQSVGIYPHSRRKPIPSAGPRVLSPQQQPRSSQEIYQPQHHSRTSSRNQNSYPYPHRRNPSHHVSEPYGSQHRYYSLNAPDQRQVPPQPYQSVGPSHSRSSSQTFQQSSPQYASYSGQNHTVGHGEWKQAAFNGQLRYTQPPYP